MIQSSFTRRRFLGTSGALAAAMTMPLDRVFAQASEALRPMILPPPIGGGERLAQLAARVS